MISRTRVTKRQQGGFTLIEAIATIVVLAALGSIASSILFTVSESYLKASAIAQMHNEASSAMERMVRELRNIPSTPTGVSIDATQTSSITWSGTSGVSLNGSQLRFSHAGAHYALANNCIAFQIQTFDHSGNVLPATMNAAQAQHVRRIIVTITLEQNGLSHTVRSGVYVRSAIALDT